ncbi:MAG: thiopurine S-methyltransferase [Gammaproteobacteria bacterium]
MHPDQWLDRWKQNRIGFHESRVNPYLPQYLPRFNLKPGDTIFLPLCGKALDIAWLAEQGFQVIGIELSEIAIISFFTEQGLQYQQFETDQFTLRKSGNISLIQGDYFALEREQLADCKMVYDRASLIAIDEDNRERYCAHMRSIIPVDANMLLITLEYEQAQMNGPPFAVLQQEVEQHYAAHYAVEVLEQNNVIDERPRWRDQGLTHLVESVYRLNKSVSP